MASDLTLEVNQVHLEDLLEALYSRLDYQSKLEIYDICGAESITGFVNLLREKE